ncbi:MAG: oxidoreductase [Hydrogenophaga sp.]|uniref:PDR/VanB family oxidoreductase n=1 Tax=Hydrogenophaga sp. TaxID=1904254 RepID=UPI001D8992D9|nr:PDR/VanB family oxidoreductase [Hydrogenophaga sp.]MBX3608869.1 oxidoreductase [Hydrogenophaga sp.]
MELSLRVMAIEWQAEGILSLRLQAAGGAPLPGYSAGAHLDLHLAPGLVRSYSLIDGYPGDAPTAYRVAVALDARTRGGSRHVHEKLRVGEWVRASLPRNHFALVEDSPFTQLVAGGIGITPLMAMADRLQALGRAWRLRWCVRSEDQLPFRDWLQRHASHIDLHIDARDGGVWAGWSGLIDGLPVGAHIYACGPAPMLVAFEQATQALASSQVHLERFGAAPPPPQAGDAVFTVRLQRSGRTVTVAPEQTVLEALQAVGMDPPSSCLQGVCGACETRVLAGVPDHRDLVLSEQERARGDTMMICCSRAKTTEIVLDL